MEKADPAANGKSAFVVVKQPERGGSLEAILSQSTERIASLPPLFKAYLQDGI